MASAISHAVVALTIGKTIPPAGFPASVLVLGMLCAIIPDADVLGFRFGIEYGAPWGHRGLTHSLFFAALLSGILTGLCYRLKSAVERWAFGGYFFGCTASHGVLDAMTNGGLGVAFFSPFDQTRYFFSFRPVLVSPIGVGEFFTSYGMQVVLSEMLWIWLPASLFFMTGRLLLRLMNRRPVQSTPEIG
ncbi:MAG TPA: metal-dependent hydrolase [Nitrospiraceae bacterium]|nr:metal-dependent hydrolase [Nitrospiraceae bacterium]